LGLEGRGGEDKYCLRFRGRGGEKRKSVV